ncbi:heavy-metal-associated domain-containing protein [Prevotella melaninogenica]|uniref:heavy-metal-associated domain-containing protein n=1 Tax=Prevotella TaxID=838 RepID=UPI0003AD0780|nr:MULTISPECIES: heavy-metal-associated domain-containing protein [Prevotella]ERJ74135.1 heavy metal-associated domain protein [Prevotella sp. F0091]QUB73028.1 heavy-metal-associated domain-containing protein [Prevotella melaninogenica]
MKKSVFAVSGMKCGHCKATVENALKTIPGVVSADANLADADVTVEYDDSLVSPSQLKEAVDNSGRFEMSL